MRKPYTLLENEILRFSWHCIEEKMRSILKKKLSQKLNSIPEYSIPKVTAAKS